LERLLAHGWDGNVRELENVIERAVLISSGDSVLPEHLLLDSSDAEAQNPDGFTVKTGCTVRQMEKTLIFQTLKEVNNNRTHAAELLGISIRTLRNKLHEYKEKDAA
jgi:DNA-binding NtrC family response regulator